MNELERLRDRKEIQAAKAEASYGRMHHDLVLRWTAEAQQDATFLHRLVMSALGRLDDEQIAREWRFYNKMERQDE